MKITDKHLEELGFDRNDISAEESGAEPYTYWSIDLSENNPNFALISNANDEREDGIHWRVMIFDTDDYAFTEVEPLTDFLNGLNKSKIKK